MFKTIFAFLLKKELVILSLVTIDFYFQNVYYLSFLSLWLLEFGLGLFITKLKGGVDTSL